MTARKINSREQASKQAELWRKENHVLVFTNGCFDILHFGHVDYLERARALGGKLIVALNTDASVQRLKGPERPIVNEASRARVMAGLEFVDMVVFFDEDTPLQVIEELKPDVLVKGGDYTPETIVGADFVTMRGGKVLSIPLVDGYSTTKFVNKIKLKR